MKPENTVPVEDRLAADVFEKSYRNFQELKSTHYRWSHLAPQSVRYLKTALAQSWSMEKLADYLNTDAIDAAQLLRRFKMSEKINAEKETADRIRRSFNEWLGRFEDLDKSARTILAKELAILVANQLYVAAKAGEDLLQVSQALEGPQDAEAEEKKDNMDSPPASSAWGPQWKD